MKKISFILILMFIMARSNAQEVYTATDQLVIESLLDESVDDEEVQTTGEELEYLLANPINAARPPYSELIRLPWVSPLLAEDIIRFTDSVSIDQIGQLRSVSLMTSLLFEKISPFLTVQSIRSEKSTIGIKPVSFNSRSRGERRFQPTVGEKENIFMGDPNASYQRIRIGSPNLEAAGLFEKDVGEKYSDGLTGGYVAVNDISFVKKLVFGNYTISSGQGLVLAKNISASKGIDAIGQTRKRGAVISPSVTTDEFRYFQGTASQWKYKKMSLTGFYSSRTLPATIDSNGMVSNFYTSGIYRSVNDLKKRNTLEERTGGGRLELNVYDHGTLVLTAMNVSYNKSISPSLFAFNDQRSISAGSLSWDIPFSRFSTFGEIATNDGDRCSRIIGFVFPLSQTVSVSYHHRIFSMGYTSPFARPFGVRSKISDGEKGNYVGVEWKLGMAIVNAFIDYFSLPSQGANFGLEGRESSLHMALPITSKFNLIFHIKNKIRFEVTQRNQTNYRFMYSARVAPHIVLSQRIEYVSVGYTPSRYTENGFLTFVDVAFNKRSEGFRMKCRLIIFDTPSFDSRLYQYESDVAGNYSNPPMYGKGIRWYVVVGYALLDQLYFSLKYSETKKLNVDVLGSGVDEIQGNRDDRIALQIDFQL